MVDAKVENLAPDMDCIVITVGDWKITVDREFHGPVYVTIEDTEEGSETRLILGQEGETQKL